MVAKQSEFEKLQGQIQGHDDYQEEAEEEKTIPSTFEDNLEATITLLRDLLDLKQVHLAIKNLNNDLDALTQAKEELPDKDHSAALKALSRAHKELRPSLNLSNIEEKHECHAAAVQLQKRLSFLSSEDKTAVPPSSNHTDVVPTRTKSVQLPKLHLPTFNGDLMEWAPFWAQFKTAVDSNPDLSQEHKLYYLKDAIKDPAVKSLMFSGAERKGLYAEVVKTLQQRYDKRRLIHSPYCQQLNTRPELLQFLDKVNHAVAGLKHTKQYDISPFTSILTLYLPKNLQVEWEVHSKESRQVPPLEDFLTFVAFRADFLSATPSAPPPEVKKEKKMEEKPYKHRASVNVSAPAPSAFRYDCPICKPEKHSLYFCPKFAEMAVVARRDYAKVNKLCFNCLIPRHRNTECRKQGQL